MAKTADTIAIYSRKSRYTGKGESIGNQIDLCREYIHTHYGDAAAEHAVVFEDEGFSGGNLNRPDFKKMMTAARSVHRERPWGGHRELPAGVCLLFAASSGVKYLPVRMLLSAGCCMRAVMAGCSFCNCSVLPP